MFRIIQESINNIIKHSSVSEAFVKISREEKFISLIISDNGKGLSMNKNKGKNSLGLSGIAERVKMLDGTMKIESAEGYGTRIEINLLLIPHRPSP